MRLSLFIIAFSILLISCNDDKDNGNLTVRGSIDGLKVGKVLLQKTVDTSLITIDSVSLDGSGDYSLSATIDEPQLLYLYLDVKDGTQYDDRIAFFAEDTVMTINSSLNNFEKDAVITGSKNQIVLAEFNKNKDKLNEVYTNLMKRSMSLNQEENPSQASIDSLNTEYEKYLKKRILYAVNYATFHKEKAVAPYILLQEGFDANPVLLDSIYKQMPKKIQTSMYGTRLSELIKESKSNL
ncbi:DUF4369 domain-containing protein [Nonlabens ponticola]|uniref:DUF4369 domain-containing protein n=1 Tax=Nonlabens ponticola TaxID=2496866 RepID=A0A3S9MWU5_9FLAO|nr:DUF4369 domain-containing protein [Nonlabens ponticola]AZQ43668.1 DUF4369 domain-containing protein [Nonlabens ponticola]